MDAFNGKWRMNSDVIGLDGYLAAVGMTDKKEMFEKPYTYEFQCDEKTVTWIKTVDGEPPFQRTINVGETSRYFVPGRGDVEACTRIEGDEVVTTQEYGGLKQVIRCLIKDGKFIVKTTAKGQTMEDHLERA